MHPAYNEALDHAAAVWGIEPQYWDIWGNLHITAPETKREILKGLGVDVSTAGSIEAAIAAREEAERTQLVPPVLVISVNRLEFAVKATGPVHILIRRENGQTDEYDAEASSAVGLPPDLELGYHDVIAAADGCTGSTRLIVTPDRAWTGPERGAGVAVQLYGLRSANDWGCGDFRDLRGIIDWVAADTSASFIALNPLHAIHNRRPFNTSPYLPNCTYYQNSIYLAVEEIEDFAKSPRAQHCWRSAEVEREIHELRAAEHVEYERVHALKLRILKLCFARFLHSEYRAGTGRAEAFDIFVAREGELLEDFAVYCALDEYLHRRHPDLWIWPQWPEAYRDPHSPETRAFRDRHWRSILFYKYVQWQIDVQLEAAQRYARDRGLSIGLYHDLALATDRYGCDLWAHRDYYASGCRVGSPPDDFSPNGQDWGFPPPNSDHHRETGYRLFSASIQKNCRHGGALRIDHVMRFFRLFWIPDAPDAARGAYVLERYAEDFLRIVALESVRNRVVLVGEDLGTVQPVVRETLARFGILSYRLFYFEKGRDGEFKPYWEYPEQALVSSTTHDLPTLAGFWINEDIESRRRAGAFPTDEAYRNRLAERAREKQKMLDLLHRLDLLPNWYPRSAADLPELTGELHNAVIGFLALTPSRLLVLNQEDLTKEPAQQNLPGTTWQYPNWGRKMKFTVEELHSAELGRAFTAMFRHWVEKTNRQNR